MIFHDANKFNLILLNLKLYNVVFINMRYINTSYLLSVVECYFDLIKYVKMTVCNLC